MKQWFRRARASSTAGGHRRAIPTFTIALGMVVVSAGLTGPAGAATPTRDAIGQGDAYINSSLSVLAKSLALAVGDSDVRSAIHNAVAKRFDGDEEALWSSLTGDRAFSNAFIAAPDQPTASIAQTASAMPQLQIAVPVHFDSWNPAVYQPLVAYVPEGVDDTKLKTVTAYDAAGRAQQVDAQDGPEQPLIVVGLNERTDERGRVLPAYAPSARRQQTPQFPETPSTAATYSVDMKIVHLIDDKEPAIKGDAEIALKARSRGCSGTNYQDLNWTNLNNDDDYWAPEGGRNLGLTTCDVVFYWWEDDGNKFDFTLSFDKFSLGVRMDDGDDLIGAKQVPHSSFEGGTLRKDGWSALTMWTE